MIETVNDGVSQVWDTGTRTVTYPEALYALATGQIDWVRGDIRVLLTTGMQHIGEQYVTDIIHEVDTCGYVSGGQYVQGRSISRNRGWYQFKTATSTVWGPLAARRAVVYSARSGLLIASIDFGISIRAIDNYFELAWPEEGLFALPSWAKPKLEN